MWIGIIFCQINIFANRNNIHEMKLWRIGIGIFLWPKYQRIDSWQIYSQTICELFVKRELFAEHWKEQRNKGTKEQKDKGAKEQRNNGTKEQRNKETKSSSNWVRHNQVSWSSFYILRSKLGHWCLRHVCNWAIYSVNLISTEMRYFYWW